MKQNIKEFLNYIKPLVMLSQIEYDGALNWLDNNYNIIFDMCNNDLGLEMFYEALKTNPDNWISVITYCDICIENNMISKINSLTKDKLFIDSKSSIEVFLEFRTAKEKKEEVALNHKQEQVAYDLNNNILLLASAGTGKTKTIAYRIVNIIKENKALPEEILCLTFTNKACKEMKEKISSLVGEHSKNIVVRTFHSFCYSIIKSEYKNKLDIYYDFIIYDEEDCKEIIIEINKLRFNVASLQNIIDYIKLSSINYSTSDRNNFKKIIKGIADNHYEELTKRCIGDGYKCDYDMIEYIENEGHILIDKYNKILKDRGALDFNDLIIKSNEILEDEAIARKWSNKYKYIHIDEVQDTNEIEYRVLSKLFNNKIMLCGDFFQTIYEWRGSNPTFVFNLFSNKYHPKTIVFERNYRATKVLLNAAIGYLKKAFDNELREYYVNEIIAESNYAGDKIILTNASNIQQEARSIYDRILNLGLSDLSKVAILTRNNNYNKSLSYEFKTIYENKPADKQLEFFLVEEYKFFRRQEIKDLIAFIKIILNKHDEYSLMRILNRFAKGIGDRTIDDITSIDNKLLGISLTDFIDINTHIYNDKYQLLINELDKSNVIVFDVETTGLNTVSDEIVQIAAVRINKSGDIMDKFLYFIRPNKSVASSQYVHGFSDEFLQKNGVNPEKALTDFMKFAEGSLIVGHNVNYDLNILASEISRLELPIFKYVGYYDTLELARRYYPNLNNHKLQTLCEYLNSQTKSSHDAMDDVLATSDVLIKITNKNIRPTLMNRISVYSAHLRKFENISGLISKFEVNSKILRPHMLLDFIIEKTKIFEIYKNEPSRIENIKMFVKIVESFDDIHLSCRDSLIELLKITSLSNTELDCLMMKEPKIPIITIHQSKGTEYDYVFLAGLQEYVFPSYPAIKSMDLSEEKRLFYVAITRAKKKLFLSWSKRDAKGMKSISRFVGDIPREYLVEG